MPHPKQELSVGSWQQKPSLLLESMYLLFSTSDNRIETNNGKLLKPCFYSLQVHASLLLTLSSGTGQKVHSPLKYFKTVPNRHLLVAHQNDKIVPRPVEPIVIKNAGDIVPLLLTLHLNLILDESPRF